MKEFMNYFMLGLGVVWVFMEMRGLRKAKSKSQRILSMQRLSLAVIIIMLSLFGFVWRANG